MSASSTVKLSFPARADYLLLARLTLTGISRTIEVNEEALADLRLAVTEAAANAVHHAYPDDVGQIEVEYTITDDGTVEITVDDAGKGFDRDAVVDWDPASLGEDGMGLAIIRAVADFVEVGPRPDGTGSRLRFVKSLV